LGLFFATAILPLEGVAAEFAYNLVRSLVAFAIFWALARATGPVGGLLHRIDGLLTGPMIDWLVRIARAAFLALGAAAILEIWGIAVGPIIAGLGLFGVAVALGAQDLFKNLISGLFVLGERRFEPGDWIRVEGVVEGTVEHIGFRTTTVRRFDKAPVYVPNSQLADRAVTNFSRMTHRRIYWVIGLEYRTTVEQLRRIRDEIEALLRADPDFAQPPEVSLFVHVDRFAESSIDLMLYCFTRTTDWGEWLKIKERLALEIKRIVEEAGSGFAFPLRALYVESLPEGLEIFPASAEARGPTSCDE
ncbi:MAG: mechanosensitive ion channel family protein, partial [Alphaproteobacteria bacterium]